MAAATTAAPSTLTLAPPPAGAQRPPDVTRAVARYRPASGTLGAADAARATRLAREAIQSLTPRIVVNRILDEAVHLLSTGGRLRTAFDLPNPTPEQREYLQRRTAAERAHGIHGEGELAGKTVYGSVQFADRLPEVTGGDRLNTGLPYQFGAAAIVLRPEVAARTTFSAGDSFFAAPRAIGGVEQLPEIVLDSMGRREVRRALRAGDEGFRGAVRAHLESLTLGAGYIEAQVRGAGLTDVQSLRLEASPLRLRSDDAAVLATSQDDILRLARRAGVPVDVQR